MSELQQIYEVRLIGVPEWPNAQPMIFALGDKVMVPNPPGEKCGPPRYSHIDVFQEITYNGEMAAIHWVQALDDKGDTIWEIPKHCCMVCYFPMEESVREQLAKAEQDKIPWE